MGNHHRTEANLNAIREEALAVLRSEVLGRSSRQAKLLEYLSSRLSLGDRGETKESTIAIEVFGRPTDFDPQNDAIVRVEAYRLRKKLEKFYAAEGSTRPNRLVLPVGQYKLELQQTEADREAPSSSGTSASPPPDRLRRRLTLVGVIILGVLLGVSVLLFSTVSNRRSAESSVTPTVPNTLQTADPEPDVARYLCGFPGPAMTDGIGRVWLPECCFSGGERISVKRESLERTAYPHLFQTARQGRFEYRIPVQKGRQYEVELFFVNPDPLGEDLNPRQPTREFSVFVNGTEVLAHFNVRMVPRGSLEIRAFGPYAPGPDGTLSIRTHPYTAVLPVLTAIRISPMPGGRIRPIRMAARIEPIVDGLGNFWAPDDYFVGGVIGRFESTPFTPRPNSEVFTSERVGDFEYFIPVPPGRYSATLYFGEGWFGRDAASRGGPGSRVFDVLINHEPVLPNFDMLHEGRPNQLIVKTFRNLKPGLNGQLRFTFTPRVDYASLRGMEISQEP